MARRSVTPPGSITVEDVDDYASYEDYIASFEAEGFEPDVDAFQVTGEVESSEPFDFDPDGTLDDDGFF